MRNDIEEMLKKIGSARPQEEFSLKFTHEENSIDFMNDLFNSPEEYKLYSSLKNGNKGKKAIGSGEASGIALAKVHNGILASNNYKDIAPYIKEYGLKHVDTGMILIEALEKGIITEEEGNTIWQKMLDRKRKLPAESSSEYLKQTGV